VAPTIFDDGGRLDLERHERAVDLRRDPLGRRPLQPLHPATRRSLIETAQGLNPIVLQRGR